LTGGAPSSPTIPAASAAAWAAWLWQVDRRSARRVALLVAANLVANLIFFTSYPIFTPYYIFPIDMLSLWTLLFATLNLHGQAAGPNRPLTRTETVQI
jgi:4-amino-4-deoxy-L-arabinose transferase-like glycosyltransferase